MYYGFSMEIVCDVGPLWIYYSDVIANSTVWISLPVLPSFAGKDEQ
jgi:hypothetical protein